ncbi:hypothetical protein CCHR01_04872 [Colletotrichum chrysophilum]|uniref:Uncharacterized protein n=1 Tax=Colletotrichum chrysophilum TaxID=1836956 RepID=A0AAD9AR81_9PEZI|nr:hypothetical protein CCHR01_04872 [Colletotrichum chrysophilum]
MQSFPTLGQMGKKSRFKNSRPRNLATSQDGPK